MTGTHRKIVEDIRARILELSTRIHLAAKDGYDTQLEKHITELRDQARRLTVVLSPYTVIRKKAV